MRALGASRTSLVPGGVLAGPWVRNDLWRRARAVPSLDLRFADNKSLVDAVTGASLVTFTRASSGTYVGSDGVLRTATTNLLLRSEEFDNAYWTKTNSSTTQDAIAAPNGTITAEKLLTDTTSSSHVVRRDETVLASTNYTLSFYAKAAEYTFLSINHGHTLVSGYLTFFDLSTGTVGTNAAGNTASIQSVGNGWYRCSVTRTTAVSQTSLSARAGACQSDNVASFVGDTASGIYIWGAQLEPSATVGEYIPTTSTINSAPRFDHNPTTGESLGLLVEEQRTNSITNNTMVGAVAGTPGTLPTGWLLAASANDISPEIVGTGVEDGITYVDIRYSGTSTGAGTVPILASLLTVNTAATGQSWTGSAYVKLQAGSLSNLTNTRQSVNGRSSTGEGLESTNDIYTPTSDGLGVQRRTVSVTLANASTEKISHTIFNAAYASGVAIDITLRIGLPQLEQGAFATSPILTSTAAVTRSADVVSITGSAFSGWYRQDEGTVFAEFRDSPSTQSEYPFSISDNTVSNRFTLFTSGSSSLNSRLSSAGSAFNPSNVSFVASSLIRACTAGKTGADQAITACNGVLSNAGSPTSMPAVDRMYIGAAHNGLERTNGTIRRLTYWPTRLADTTLQSLTQ